MRCAVRPVIGARAATTETRRDGSRSKRRFGYHARRRGFWCLLHRRPRCCVSTGSKTVRIRQVKPAFWSDAVVSALPAPARLFYIGLWMVADDAGWLRWDPVQIANELYGYESRKRRERDVETFLALLVTANRVVVHDCGHAEIPKLVTHQHLSIVSKQVRTIQREHADCRASRGMPEETRGDPPTPAETRESPAGKGKGKGNGKVKGNGDGDGGGKVNGKGSARSLAPEGATALTDEENLPLHLRIVNVS